MKNIIPHNEKLYSLLPFDKVTSAVELDGVTYGITWQKDGENFCGKVPGAAISCSVKETEQGFKLFPSAKLEKAVDHFKLHLLSFPSIEVDHFAGCGFKMGQAKIISFPAPTSTFSCSHNCVLTRKAGQVIFSSPLKQSYDNSFKGRTCGKFLLDFGYIIQLDSSIITEMVFDPITVEYGNAVDVLTRYALDNVETPRDFSSSQPCGWNSWDYYRWTITEDEVIKNAEFIAGDPVLSRYVKRIIVDDGWQYCYGEWEANALFPSGMKSLADRLTGMGFTPGLWLAPSIVEPHCRIAQWDHDMLALSKGGQPCLAYSCMSRYGFVLDPTVEKSRSHLKKLFDRYAAMGYKYFKLDFLASTMLAERFHDGSVPRCRIMRMLLDPIVEGVAGRAEILGCNYHFYNGNSYVNSVRVGADIHAKWQSVKSNTRSVAYMFWANKKLWINDPDFAVCRGPETSEDPDLNRLLPSLVGVRPADDYLPGGATSLGTILFEEAKVLLSIVMMAGGAVNLSDKMYLLNEKGLDLVRKTVAAESGEAAVPLDLFESTLPSYWLQKTSHGRRLLVINWEDTPAGMSIDWQRIGRKPSQVRDFWNGTVSPCPEKAELAPHSCILIEF